MLKRDDGELSMSHGDPLRARPEAMPQERHVVRGAPAVHAVGGLSAIGYASGAPDGPCDK